MVEHDHLLIGFVVVALAITGCVGIGTSNSPTPDDGVGSTPGASNAAADQRAGANGSMAPAANAGYADLYDRTIDSVVEIQVRTERGRSQGSGFVYNAEGYIVTNQHVVGGADRAQVRFPTGAWKMADVVGTDVYTDLAVLKVDSLPDGVEAIPVAEREPEPGQPVVALGTPLGYEGSITHGIVSGVNRSMSTGQGFSIPDTVQTDAPINPGNSGGPLVSMNGTVVGVNRAKQGDNLGFAISADLVSRVVPELVEDGSYDHSFLGIQTVPVAPRIAQANDLESASGVMVVDVLESGPAGGVLQPAEPARTETGARLPVGGDVIVSVEGRPIPSQQVLAQYLMLHTRPGEELTVTVLRDGERVTETITLGRRPQPDLGGSV